MECEVVVTEALGNTEVVDTDISNVVHAAEDSRCTLVRGQTSRVRDEGFQAVET